MDKSVLSKVKENMHTLNKEPLAHNVKNVLIQSAVTKHVMHQNQNLLGKVVEQLIVAESERMIVPMGHSNAQGAPDYCVRCTQC